MDQSPLNPYAPPAAPVMSNEAPAPARGEYRPLLALATALTVVLALDSLLEVVVAANAVTTISAIDRVAAGAAVEETVLGSLEERAVAVGLGQLALGLAALVFFCIFVARASRNAHSFGQMRMQLTPGWAVGFFFIPIASWSSTWRTSTSSRGRRRLVTPVLSTTGDPPTGRGITGGDDRNQ